jgi:hypothetical protein
MSKSKSLLTSVAIAGTLLLVLMVGIVSAEAPEGMEVDAASSAATSNITYTADYCPKTISDFGSYTFTYTIALHNTTTDTSPITPTFVLTLSEDLDFDKASGTVVLPEAPEGTLEYPGGNVIEWSPVLTYCKWHTLTVKATADVDQGSLMLPALTTEWQLGEETGTMETPLVLPRLYLPLVVKNFE